MTIKEYITKNKGKQVLFLDEKEIKSLMHFSSTARNGDYKGLIASGKYIGFTNTYNLAAIEVKHKELSGIDSPKIYSYEVLEKLKKAHSISIVNDGTLAIQVGDEVTEYQPLNTKAIDIRSAIENLEYTTFLKTKIEKEILDSMVWGMIKQTYVDAKKYFIFKDNKFRIEVYPNEESKLVLDMFEYEKDKLDITFNFNVKYLALWFKYVKNNSFVLSLSKPTNAVRFENGEVVYIVMPMLAYED